MATLRDRPLVVIAGPTASGKTALAIKLARKFNGEIICADSRTIYKGMDIGTAKPSLGEQTLVPHWGLDLVEPGQRFTVADFKSYTDNKIREIRSRGKVPFLVGGTGLYIDAVIFNFTFLGGENNELRQELVSYNIQQLKMYCIKNNIKLPENDVNKRYLIRSIETKNTDNMRSLKPLENSIVVAIATDKEQLRTRIEFRAEQIINHGVVKETTNLLKKYGIDNEAMKSNIYPLVNKYINGQINLEELIVKSATTDWRLAKRQLTWLRRNPYLIWCDTESAEHYLLDRLDNG